MVIYLYGDLAIYGAAVAKSLRDVACTYKPPNMTSPLNISESEVSAKFEVYTALRFEYEDVVFLVGKILSDSHLSVAELGGDSKPQIRKEKYTF